MRRRQPSNIWIIIGPDFNLILWFCVFVVIIVVVIETNCDALNRRRTWDLNDIKLIPIITYYEFSNHKIPRLKVIEHVPHSLCFTCDLWVAGVSFINAFRVLFVPKLWNKNYVKFWANRWWWFAVVEKYYILLVQTTIIPPLLSFRFNANLTSIANPPFTHSFKKNNPVHIPAASHAFHKFQCPFQKWFLMRS